MLIRRRVSYKADTREGGRTARNSRNASRASKKILQMAARKDGGVSCDPRKASARRCSIQGAQSRRGTGKGYREGGKAAHRGGGNIRGKREDRSRGGRQAGTTSEKVRRVGVVWVQLLARAYIYSSYI